ncbi:hypothetical protein FOMPIDRAFT_1025406 [Fomitopsis schrenkii]|uniref:BHLH domain-containing protein n=1 Tax=Fomitopsis schrenkii TaxID=2126942 RepID=S8DT21_FOMSC|nr:hypothetical protein FOMPIDRAFT_1025406 [Fomitopsis schrenkii]
MASCNPPRRAKRARTDGANVTPNAAHAAASSRAPVRRARPTILPKGPAPRSSSPAKDVPDSDTGDEDDYEPDTRTTAQRRRGRKPGTLSRSARESLRKLNHSRIEKARRTKINEALASLSALVNEAEQEKATAAGVTLEPKAKGRAEEKEFKLDVLVKTVTYVQELINKVRALEDAARACPHCSRDRVAAFAPALKRKRPGEEDIEMGGSADELDEEIEYAGDDEKGDGEPEPGPERSPVFVGTAPPPASAHPTPSPRLPPIAAWLPHPYVDPSCIAAISDSRNAAAAASQLPSPPPSASSRAASTMLARDMPALVLPAPAHPLEASTAAPGEKTVGRRAGTQSRSPTWTPEDETAASLLLQIGSSPTSMRSSSAPSSVGVPPFALPARRMSLTLVGEDGRRGKGGVRIQAETPSSLLGLGR